MAKVTLFVVFPREDYQQETSFRFFATLSELQTICLLRQTIRSKKKPEMTCNIEHECLRQNLFVAFSSKSASKSCRNPTKTLN